MNLKEYLEAMFSQEMKAAPTQEKTNAAVQGGNLKTTLDGMVKAGKSRNDLINAARAAMLKQHKDPDEAEKAAVNYVNAHFKGVK